MMNSMKIVIYIFLVLFLIIMALPLLVLISICLVLFSGFPILYKQYRVGKGGKPFILYKFRTMKLDAEQSQSLLKKRNEADGPVFKIRNDPRFTSVGKFLSHTGLDELPQLFNVLKGDMALIGPRPLPIAETAKLTKIQKKRLLGKPGIISPWIINGYHKQTFSDWMSSDLKYINQKNVITDIMLAYKTSILLLKLLLREVKSLLLKNT